MLSLCRLRRPERLHVTMNLNIRSTVSTFNRFGRSAEPKPKGSFQMKSIDPHMHTAEHILNQTMVRLLGCERCFSAHIEKKKSKCDYHVTSPPAIEDMQGIEAQVNRIIQADLTVHAITLPRAEAARTFNLARLPADAGDTIRIVNVGDYDACPCRGRHVSHTGELGTFRITSWDTKDHVLRIRFKLKRATGRPMESP